MHDRYDIQQTWKWNLQNPPNQNKNVPTKRSIPKMPGDWSLMGLPVQSCLSVPAGPLLNSDWLLYYSRLGFDVLTYKTVRSASRQSFPLPNLQAVADDNLTQSGQVVQSSSAVGRSWAVSFGMPSVKPSEWKADIRRAKDGLAKGQVLIVSVVGEASQTVESADQSLETLAQDYARCARWAVESGADAIEANFSCPNVCSKDGQLYHDSKDASCVAGAIKTAIGNTPLMIKIGFVNDSQHARQLIEELNPHVQGLCMTNSIAARVSGSDQEMLFDSLPRGICGKAIHERSVRQVELFRRLIEQTRSSIDLSAVGGVFQCEDVIRFLDAGANVVGMATSAMLNPKVAIEIRERWATIRP